jgi:hypothetical protein
MRNGKLDEWAASLPYYPDLANFNLQKAADEYTMKTALGNEATTQYCIEWHNQSGQTN